MLVFDTFKGHLEEDVMSKLAQSNITYVTIPGGCTSKIQPLDVCLNKPFKAYIRGVWEEYMAEKAISTHTAAAQIPTVSAADIVEWLWMQTSACMPRQTW